ncbi:MAG TPA: GYD domain-containing protein [Prolixibacteraceae bacterium]|nr:GYD domain-containing protein [Prolixibacteraceae bacterium]
MRKYLIKGTYNPDGTKGLIQEGGSGRKTAIEKMLADMGGRVEAFYFAFGEDDVILIVELPDDITAVAVGLRVNAAGLVRISMTVLISPEDIDAASKKSVSYRAPGAK